MFRPNLYDSILTERYLVDKYVRKKLTTYDIANSIGCSAQTVTVYLKKYGICTRDIKEAMNTKRSILKRSKISKVAQNRMGVSESKSRSLRLSWSVPGVRESRSGSNSSLWLSIGSVRIDRGYRYVKIAERDWEAEHRIVIEQFIGRFIEDGEQTHHIDENRSNNSLCNLMLFSNNGAHRRFHCRGYSGVKPEEIIFDGSMVNV